MTLEFYKMPIVSNAWEHILIENGSDLETLGFLQWLNVVLDVSNYIFTFVFVVEAALRIVSLGFIRYLKVK